VDSVRARGLAPQEEPRAKRLAVDFPPGYEDKHRMHDRNIADELRSRLRRQDAFVFAVGLLLLAVAAAAVIYVYWDNGRPFESTDDAFIARRQFPMVVRAILARSDTSGCSTTLAVFQPERGSQAANIAAADTGAP
jgi:hypothetical protein